MGIYQEIDIFMKICLYVNLIMIPTFFSSIFFLMLTVLCITFIYINGIPSQQKIYLMSIEYYLVLNMYNYIIFLG